MADFDPPQCPQIREILLKSWFVERGCHAVRGALKKAPSPVRFEFAVGCCSVSRKVIKPCSGRDLFEIDRLDFIRRLMIVGMETAKHKRDGYALVIKVDLIAAVPNAFHIQFELKTNMLVGP